MSRVNVLRMLAQGPNTTEVVKIKARIIIKLNEPSLFK